MLWRYLLFSIIIYNSPALFTLFRCSETSHKGTVRSFPLMLYSTYVVWWGFFLNISSRFPGTFHPEIPNDKVGCGQIVAGAVKQIDSCKSAFPIEGL